MTTEANLYPAILALSRGPTRLFRQQSLMSWAGRILSRTHDTITLYKPRAVTVGVPGMADIGGLTSVVITADMVGQTLAVAVQIEAKGPKTRVEQVQRDYLAMCVRLGGRAGIARSVEEAARIIAGEQP
jgi:hypothetical protein